MGLIGLLMASYGGLEGILSGLTKSTDHPSRALTMRAYLEATGAYRGPTIDILHDPSVAPVGCFRKSTWHPPITPTSSPVPPTL